MATADEIERRLGDILRSGQKLVILHRGKIFIQGLPQGTLDLSPRL